MSDRWSWRTNQFSHSRGTDTPRHDGDSRSHKKKPEIKPETEISSPDQLDTTQRRDYDQADTKSITNHNVINAAIVDLGEKLQSSKNLKENADYLGIDSSEHKKQIKLYEEAKHIVIHLSNENAREKEWNTNIKPKAKEMTKGGDQYAIAANALVKQEIMQLVDQCRQSHTIFADTLPNQELRSRVHSLFQRIRVLETACLFCYKYDYPDQYRSDPKYSDLKGDKNRFNLDDLDPEHAFEKDLRATVKEFQTLVPGLSKHDSQWTPIALDYGQANVETIINSGVVTRAIGELKNISSDIQTELTSRKDLKQKQGYGRLLQEKANAYQDAITSLGEFSALPEKERKDKWKEFVQRAEKKENKYILVVNTLVTDALAKDIKSSEGIFETEVPHTTESSTDKWHEEAPPTKELIITYIKQMRKILDHPNWSVAEKQNRLPDIKTMKEHLEVMVTMDTDKITSDELNSVIQKLNNLSSPHNQAQG